jgi:hypothetical protein
LTASYRRDDVTTDTLAPDLRAAIAALCAALDAGDDSALYALADALEEAGDPRAAGLRAVRLSPAACHLPRGDGARCYWQPGPINPADPCWGGVPPPPHAVPRDLFARLLANPHLGVARHAGGWPVQVYYPSRSAAYLALAEALAEEAATMTPDALFALAGFGEAERRWALGGLASYQRDAGVRHTFGRVVEACRCRAVYLPLRAEAAAHIAEVSVHTDAGGPECDRVARVRLRESYPDYTYSSRRRGGHLSRPFDGRGRFRGGWEVAGEANLPAHRRLMGRLDEVLGLAARCGLDLRSVALAEAHADA